MFSVRTRVRENALSVEELAQIGVTPELVTIAIESAPCAWVAEVQDRVVGFSMVDLETACLFAVFVLPEFEGEGIGKRLIQASEAALFDRHPVAWLESAKSSRAACVYRHLGWENEQEVGDGDVRLEKRRQEKAAPADT